MLLVPPCYSLEAEALSGESVRLGPEEQRLKVRSALTPEPGCLNHPTLPLPLCHLCVTKKLSFLVPQEEQTFPAVTKQPRGCRFSAFASCSEQKKKKSDSPRKISSHSLSALPPPRPPVRHKVQKEEGPLTPKVIVGVPWAPPHSKPGQKG